MKHFRHLVVAAAAACVMSWGGAAIADEVDDFLKLESTPTFDSPSSEAVQLRYRFKAGQVLKLKMESSTDMLMRHGAQKLNMKQSMDFDAKMAVTEVDSEGNISAVLKMTRFRMKVSGLQTVEFDSDDKENANEAFAPLLAMIDVGIPCKMSPVGELLETDLEPMRLAMRRAGDAAFAKEFEKTTDKMFEGAFVQLAKEPVKTGATYKAGTVLEDKTKIHLSYKIGAISGDRKKVVLEPIADMEIKPDAFPGAQVTLKSKRMAGWVLFDLEKGYPAGAEARVHVLMDVKAEGQLITIEAKSSMKTNTTITE